MLEEVLNTPAFRLHLIMFYHNKRLMGYFEFLHGSGIICLPLIFQKNSIDKISSKSQSKQRLVTFILVNIIQQPRTLKNNIYHSSKRVPPPFFHSDTNPVFGLVLSHSFRQNPCSGCNSGIDLVVAFEYTFFQLCYNAEQISVRLARFRRSYVTRPAVVLPSHKSYTAFLLGVCCAVQSGHVPFLQLFVPDDSVFA